MARQDAAGQPVGGLVKQLSEQATPLARQEVELLGGQRAAGRDHGPPEPGPFALQPLRRRVPDRPPNLPLSR
ncbi:MAG TPA: hypothetical protein VHI73_05570 [Solirubrobacteraceae bacterium]|nr:hypothetical protein [Solirubrobacteraceae bacterium]